MKKLLCGTAVCLSMVLSACGGGDGGSSAPPPVQVTPPAPTPSPTAGCSLLSRQNWVNSQIRNDYLFLDTLPASLDPAGFSSVQAYIDGLTATARAQGKDRFFTFITSIAEENAFFASGSSAGFGVRLSTDVAARRLFVAEAFEGAPALAAGIDRATEILAIGTTASDIRTVDAIIAAEGSAGVTAALGPSTPGTTRVLRFRNASGTIERSVTKADFAITPVSSRYGALVLNDGAKKVGYLNLRTFISTADPALRSAFAGFRSQGITEVIVDFRYNGGGLVSIAELMGDLLGANRSTAEQFSRTVFNVNLASNNSTRNFRPQAESIAPMKIAFIGTGSSASASELVMNAFIPYLRANTALIGSNTSGKPVGQIARDRAECDDRLRVVAFATQNAAGQGDYFNGLASKFDATCQASDDITRQLGDPAEASTRAALDFLAGRVCTRIGASSGIGTRSLREGGRELLTPDQPDVAQREVPGYF